MSVPDDTDWKAVAVQLAAIDHRAAGIVEAADKLAEAVDRELRVALGLAGTAIVSRDRLTAALDAYKIVRNGS